MQRLLSHNGERLFTYGARGSAKAWDLHSLQQVCTFPHELAVSSIAISPDDETLAISSLATARSLEALSSSQTLNTIEYRIQYDKAR